MLKPITLKNGLTVLRLPKPGSKMMAISFILNSGSAIEEGYFPQGITHLVQRLFWCGTDKNPSKKHLNSILDGLGGNFDSFTSEELFGLTISVPDFNQSKAVSLMAEIVQGSYFDARDIEREKKNFINKLKEESADLISEVAFLPQSNLYQNSSLGLPINGSVESVSGITQSDILEFISRQLRPDQSYLIISGSFDNKTITDLVDQEWSKWIPPVKNYIQLLPFTQEDVGTLPRSVYRQRGIAQTYVSLSFLLDEGLKPKVIQEYEENADEKELNYSKILDQYLLDSASLLLLNTILGQGLSSRLWTKCVEEELLFNNIESRLKKFSTTGYLEISGEIENTQFSFGLESVLSVLESLKKTTIPLNELAKAKGFLKGKLIMETENILQATLWKVENLIGSGLNFELEDLLAKIDSVDINLIRLQANSLFAPEKLLISSFGPAKETRLVDKLIRKYLI